MTRDETSTSVQTHLTILQGVIERMASNSKSLKAWCITIVAAILVVVAGKDKPDYVLIALIPIVMFCALDTYYLALERGFRKAYEGFVRKLHDGTLTINDMYVVKPIGKMWSLWTGAFLSPSVWLFYVLSALWSHLLGKHWLERTMVYTMRAAIRLHTIKRHAMNCAVKVGLSLSPFINSTNDAIQSISLSPLKLLK